MGLASCAAFETTAPLQACSGMDVVRYEFFEGAHAQDRRIAPKMTVEDGTWTWDFDDVAPENARIYIVCTDKDGDTRVQLLPDRVTSCVLSFKTPESREMTCSMKM